MGNLLFSVNGRIGRKTWWLTNLAMMVVGIVVMGILGTLFGMSMMVVDEVTGMPVFSFIGALPMIAINIVFLWVSIALSVKRLHDNDMRGWWYLLVLVPLLGPLALLIICGFIKGDEDANRFGEPVV